jgi:hypothetical protein
MGSNERSKGDRVVFERGIPAHMMGIDGTWRRDCTVEDISETGAKLTIEGSVRRSAPEGILPAAVVHWPCLSAL